MAIVNEEMTELRRLTKRVKQKNIDQEELNMHISIYKQMAIREKLCLDALKLVAVYKVFTLSDLKAMNLITYENPLKSPPESFEDEEINCPAQDKDITRSDCLDFSGESANVMECKECDNFAETRKVLLHGKEAI